MTKLRNAEYAVNLFALSRLVLRSNKKFIFRNSATCIHGLLGLSLSLVRKLLPQILPSVAGRITLIIPICACYYLELCSAVSI